MQVSEIWLSVTGETTIPYYDPVSADICQDFLNVASAAYFTIFTPTLKTKSTSVLVGDFKFFS